jgi:Flp pilus assembly protein TadB
MSRSMRWGAHPTRQAIAYGLLSGAVYGALQGLGDRSIGKAVVSGLLFGAVMSAVHYAGLRANAHLSGLRPQEQRKVSAAVRRGQAVADPSLAAAAIRHAQNVQQRSGDQRLGKLLAWGLLGASVLALGLTVWAGSTPGVISAGFSCLVWVLILVLGPRLERRTQDRARAAELATTRLVEGRGPSVPG